VNAAIAIAIAAFIVLAGAVVFATARRRDTRSAIGLLSRETRQRDRSASTALPEAEQAPTGREVERAAVQERTAPGTELAPVEAAAPVPWTPPDPEALAVTRRQFLNRGIVGTMLLSISGFSAAIVAFLWPQLTGGLGSKIRVGSVEDILGEIRATREPKYVSEGRFYLNPYPSSALDAAKGVYEGGVLTGMEAGLVALYQVCPHLGCKVPWCKTSQWFECPCHGSKYNRAGEKKAGPAPRGMDRFGIEVSGGVASVDTGLRIVGPPIGVNTTGQEAEGPACISS
jgi:cytochrome b6-f complex iron-sulfur subunit